MRTATQLAFIGEQQITHIRRPRRRVTARRDRTLVARILHLGAGRQSSWLAEAIVLGELPRVDLAIFADTGDEPHWVLSQVAYLKERLASVAIPLAVVKRSERGLVEDIRQNVDQRFASLPLYTKDTSGK